MPHVCRQSLAHHSSSSSLHVALSREFLVATKWPFFAGTVNQHLQSRVSKTSRPKPKPFITRAQPRHLQHRRKKGKLT